MDNAQRRSAKSVCAWQLEDTTDQAKPLEVLRWKTVLTCQRSTHRYHPSYAAVAKLVKGSLDN
eukprot:5040659-Amphidinium_carterae.1